MRVRLVIGLLLAGSLVVPASASACDCNISGPKEKLRGAKGAVIAKLLEVEPTKSEFGEADFTYRIRRVFKGRDRFGLHAGDELVIESYLSGATCGLPQGKRLYGLLLYSDHQRPTSNLCSLLRPAQMRKAADSRGGEPVRAVRCPQRSQA